MNIRETLWDQIRRITEDERISAPSRGADLKFSLDSLDITALASFIEKTWAVDLATTGYTRLDFENLDTIVALVELALKSKGR